MKEAPQARIARDVLKYFVHAGFVTHGTDASIGFIESILPMAVGSVDRLEEIPQRLAFIFDWDAARAADLVRGEPDGARAVQAFADEIASLGPLTRDTFRAAAGRARDRTGLKGRALFHPIRVAVTAADSGPELDLAIPAIDFAAALPPGSGLASVTACRDRARLVSKTFE